MSVRGSDIKLFHSYRKEVLDIVKNEFKAECGCEFDQNVSFDQLPTKRGWHNHEILDVCDYCYEGFEIIRDQLRASDDDQDPYDEREGMYDNPHYYQSLIEK